MVNAGSAKEYEILLLQGEPDWDRVPVLPIDESYDDQGERIRAFAQICGAQDALAVHLWAEEANLRAVENGPLGAPCEDSCLEFFFCPMPGDSRYFNFEMNPNACIYLGFGSCIGDLVRLIPEEGFGLFCPTVQTGDGRWDLFFRIPAAFVRRFFPEFSITPGKTIRANCYKCSDNKQPPHYYSWNRLRSWPCSFHSPEDFGVMHFAEHI